MSLANDQKLRHDHHVENAAGNEERYADTEASHTGDGERDEHSTDDPGDKADQPAAREAVGHPAVHRNEHGQDGDVGDLQIGGHLRAPLGRDDTVPHRSDHVVGAQDDEDIAGQQHGGEPLAGAHVGKEP